MKRSTSGFINIDSKVGSVNIKPHTSILSFHIPQQDNLPNIKAIVRENPIIQYADLKASIRRQPNAGHISSKLPDIDALVAIHSRCPVAEILYFQACCQFFVDVSNDKTMHQDDVLILIKKAIALGFKDELRAQHTMRQYYRYEISPVQLAFDKKFCDQARQDIEPDKPDTLRREAIVNAYRFWLTRPYYDKARKLLDHALRLDKTYEHDRFESPREGSGSEPCSSSCLSNSM